MEVTPELKQAIVNLRAKQLAPKQIARQLGLRPSEVTAIIKAQAEQVAHDRQESGELPPIYECLVNPNCLNLLLPDRGTAIQLASSEDFEFSSSGLAVVLVSRTPGFNRLEVCTYLVDTWCLGVKNALGPRKVSMTGYNDFKNHAYGSFEQDPVAIPLQLAQAIVLGGLDYAAKLGIKPHPDFEQARGLLGTWNGEPKLNFGRDGKPFYISGPYDNPGQIFRTLQNTVGEGQFDYIAGLGE